MRMTEKDLAGMCETVNKQIKEISGKIGFCVGYRYGYTAIDEYYFTGGMKDTLIAGLTKSQAYDILRGISRTLLNLKWKE